MAYTTACILALSIGIPAGAQAVHSDSAKVVAVVDMFHRALASGDSVRAVAALSADVLVLESGVVQSRAEYLSHHLGADMKASAGAKGVRTLLSARILGDAAYVVSRTVTPPSGAEGSSGAELAELMVLSRTASGWTIRAVHWSSRRRRS